MADLRPVELQPFTRDDIPRLCSWLTSERDLLAWGGPYYTHPLTSDALFAVLQAPAVAAGTHRLYRVYAPGLRQVIGHGELAMLNLQHRSARLARLMIGPPELRGQRFGQALIRRLLDLAFDELRLHRVELEVYDFNRPAIRCYEACGFEIEGRRRDAARYGDGYWTSILMARLEPEERRAALKPTTHEGAS